jgi:L-fuconolactonase
MIDFPIVDAHVHLWDPGRLRYPWLDGIPHLNRPFLLEDFDRARGPVPIEAIVFLQCECLPEQAMQELEWVSALAEADARIRGIVPWAPIERGDGCREALERLRRNPRVRGVRRILQDEPDPEFCLRPHFVRGGRLLGEMDLPFDICIRHAQMDAAIRLVQACPEVRFILDHVGKPDIAGRRMDPWKDRIESLASLPNVWCKVSGMVTEADHRNWKDEDLRPYIDHVLACFGFDRAMFGGDWPVAELASEYPRWVEILSRAVADRSGAERGKLFRDNAVAFYRL